MSDSNTVNPLDESVYATEIYTASQSGRNSEVECKLPKLDVVGSIPIARSHAREPQHHNRTMIWYWLYNG